MEKELYSEFTETLSEMYDQLSSGLSYTHTRINFNTTKTLESSSFLYALVELLNEKGLFQKCPSAQSMKIVLFSVGGLIVRIMKNGRCGWIMRKKSLISN